MTRSKRGFSGILDADKSTHLGSCTIALNGNNVEFLSAPIPFYEDVEVQLIEQEEGYLVAHFMFLCLYLLS